MEITLNETERAELVAAPGHPVVGRARAPSRDFAHAGLQSGQCLQLGHGLAGLRERSRPGKPRRLDPAAERLLTTLLETDPHHQGYHATGWTVPLLRTELGQVKYPVSQRTIRRTLHRLG